MPAYSALVTQNPHFALLFTVQEFKVPVIPERDEGPSDRSHGGWVGEALPGTRLEGYTTSSCYWALRATCPLSPACLSGFPRLHYAVGLLGKSCSVPGTNSSRCQGMWVTFFYQKLAKLALKSHL